MLSAKIRFYYKIKRFIPRRLQIALRRRVILRQRNQYANVWPIDERAATPPPGWNGWPEGKRFALVLTHDVDTAKGHERCRDLMNLEMSLGFRSSFNFVAERYSVSSEFRSELMANGFEVGVHGLYHDGKYYDSREIFAERARKINEYLKAWGVVGYRSPSMHHNLDWIHDLDIEYDCSTFDTDPFEPQSTGVQTIFPFCVVDTSSDSSYVELPYTLPQDFTLFVLLGETTTDIWQEKLDWLVRHGGMALMNTHPDYMSFGGKERGLEEYPAAYYSDFLKHIRREYAGAYWHVRPREISRFWAQCSINRPSR
jgi:hypothetical protein